MQQKAAAKQKIQSPTIFISTLLLADASASFCGFGKSILELPKPILLSRSGLILFDERNLNTAMARLSDKSCNVKVFCSPGPFTCPCMVTCGFKFKKQTLIYFEYY